MNIKPIFAHFDLYMSGGSKVSVHGTKTVSWTWSTSAKSGAQEYADNSDLGMKYKVVLARTSETNLVLKSEEICKLYYNLLFSSINIYTLGNSIFYLITRLTNLALI